MPVRGCWIARQTQNSAIASSLPSNKDFTTVRLAPLPSAPAHVQRVTTALSARLASLWRDDTTDSTLIRICARTGQPAAVERARALLGDAATKPELRLSMVQLLGELGDPADVERLLELTG